MSRTAESYIEAFKRGEKFTEPSEGLVSGGKITFQAVEVLGKALAVEGNDVREQIVALLWDVSKRTNPEHPYELRDPEIIALFAGPGLAKPDFAKGNAMGGLLHVMPAQLKRYGEAITRALEAEPEENAFLLVAHAKVFQAKEIVERSAWDSTSFVKEARIARAALGNTEVEDEILKEVRRMEEAGDVEALILGTYPLGMRYPLDTLARIGTRRSLITLAKFMRSPLEREVGHMGMGLESIRLYVMDALKIAFPNQADKLLSRYYVESDADYRAVEDFCVRELGVSYEGMPRPEFLTEIAAPTPIQE
jgi:hypothetical protein